MLQPNPKPAGWVKYYEFKSYKEVGGIPLDQFKNYLSTIDELSELRYVFDGRKISLVEAKVGMKEFLKRNKEDVWQIINVNSNLKTYLGVDELSDLTDVKLLEMSNIFVEVN